MPLISPRCQYHRCVIKTKVTYDKKFFSSDQPDALIIIIIIIKSYYGAPQPVLRSASQHKLQLKEA